MTDVFDRAQEREMLDRAADIRVASVQALMPAVGACYDCDGAIGPGLTFFDVDCRDDYEKRARADALAGRGARHG